MALPESALSIVTIIAKHTWRFLFAVAVTAFVMLCFWSRFGTYDSNLKRTGLIAAFIFALAFLLSYPLAGIYHWIAGHAGEWRVRHASYEYLHHLSNDEKAHCKWFLENNGDSLHRNVADGALASLAENGILYTPGQSWRNTQLRDFRIRPWALKYLREHPDLVIGKVGATEVKH